MSTVYLGLAASAGAAAVYAGRRLSVKFRAGGDDAAEGGNGEAGPELSEIVVAGHEPNVQKTTARDGVSTPTANSTPSTAEAASGAGTPPAIPRPVLSLDLSADPIVLPAAPSVAELPTASSPTSTPPLPSIVEETHLHAAPAAEGDHDEHVSRSPPSSRSISPVSQEGSYASSSPIPAPPSRPPPPPPVAADPPVAAPMHPDELNKTVQRRLSNLNLAAPEFSPSGPVALAATNTIMSSSPTDAVLPSPPQSEQGEDAGDDAQSNGDKKPKKLRCAYWPNCKFGTLCIYWHPLEKCRNEENRARFPNGCIYGTRCFFYHDHEVEFLASIGVYPPYPRSLGIGPSTPLSGASRRLSSSSLANVAMTHPQLRKQRSMSMIVASPDPHDQTPPSVGPRRMRSATQLRRESAMAALPTQTQDLAATMRPSRRREGMRSVMQWAEQVAVGGEQGGSVSLRPAPAPASLGAAGAELTSQDSAVPAAPAPGAGRRRTSSFNVHAPAFTPSFALPSAPQA
ncbi:hypothetical protein GGF31_002840 [Allomyces arbusculus]|nr:hypothetical protein GGF31_002840 [Allomyces arbusculus]